MVGGQVADLEAERKPVTRGELAYIHRSKTAALIRASVVAGAILRRRDAERCRAACGDFGDNIGWAFQVVDDILDVEESSAALGKTAGKDQAQQKATYPCADSGCAKSHEFAKELAIARSQSSTPIGRTRRASARTGGILGVAPHAAVTEVVLPFRRLSDTCPGESKIKPKERLDLLLVERGLAESRQKAQAMLLAGEVRVDGQRHDKPGERVPRDVAISKLAEAHLRYASRGGFKLEGALEDFWRRSQRKRFVSTSVRPPEASRIACCSTAQRAFIAVDVTPEQMDWRLQQDPRVTTHSPQRARTETK